MRRLTALEPCRRCNKETGLCLPASDQCRRLARSGLAHVESTRTNAAHARLRCRQGATERARARGLLQFWACVWMSDLLPCTQTQISQDNAHCLTNDAAGRGVRVGPCASVPHGLVCPSVCTVTARNEPRPLRDATVPRWPVLLHRAHVSL